MKIPILVLVLFALGFQAHADGIRSGSSFRGRRRSTKQLPTTTDGIHNTLKNKLLGLFSFQQTESGNAKHSRASDTPAVKLQRMVSETSGEAARPRRVKGKASSDSSSKSKKKHHKKSSKKGAASMDSHDDSPHVEFPNEGDIEFEQVQEFDAPEATVPTTSDADIDTEVELPQTSTSTSDSEFSSVIGTPTGESESDAAVVDTTQADNGESQDQPVDPTSNSSPPPGIVQTTTTTTTSPQDTVDADLPAGATPVTVDLASLAAGLNQNDSDMVDSNLNPTTSGSNSGVINLADLVASGSGQDDADLVDGSDQDGVTVLDTISLSDPLAVMPGLGIAPQTEPSPTGAPTDALIYVQVSLAPTSGQSVAPMPTPPTQEPTVPTLAPTGDISAQSVSPTSAPTFLSTDSSTTTADEQAIDTSSPTANPSPLPTLLASTGPTIRTDAPSIETQTQTPTAIPSLTLLSIASPTTTADEQAIDTSSPTADPSPLPTLLASTGPTIGTDEPIIETQTPTAIPTPDPTQSATSQPESQTPTASPSREPSRSATSQPSTFAPTLQPTPAPSNLTSTDDAINDNVTSDVVDPTPDLIMETLLTKALQGGAEFATPTTYQSRAYGWLKASKAERYPDWRIIQRYALVCIFIATYAVRTPYTDDFFGAGTAVYGWVEADNWLSNRTECVWTGVVCNENEEVTGLELYSNWLTGIFPDEVILLNNTLESLDVYNNPVFKASAEQGFYANLRNLKYLYFGSTNFQYDAGIPPEIGQLTRLVEFDCSYTYFAGEIDGSVFEKMFRLETIIMGDNPWGSRIPEELALLPNLQYLYMENAALSGDLSFIVLMPKIVELWMEENPDVTGEIPAAIGMVKTLESLSIADLSLTGSIPPEMGELENLRELWAYGNKLVGSVPTEFSKLALLETLELYGNDLTGIPEEICSLKELAALSTLTADCEETACTCCENCA